MTDFEKIEEMRRWFYNRKKELESGYRGDNSLYGIATIGEFNVAYSKFKEIFENKKDETEWLAKVIEIAKNNKPVIVKHETPLRVLSAVTKGYGD